MIRSLFALGLTAALLSVSSPALADSTIRCESSDGNWRACSVDTRGGVTLSRQLSRSGCWQGDTWGYDRNRIWVTNGCRAEFRVGSSNPSSRGNNNGAIAGALIVGAIAGAVIANHNDRDDDRYDRPNCGPRGCDNDYGYGQSRRFTCESRNGNQQWCGERVGRRDHVDVARQLSRGECQYGRSWGVDRGEVWVDRGCRAEFVISSR